VARGLARLRRTLRREQGFALPLALTTMMAVGALASMIGWPIYRLIKNTRKRGRLPDMKPIRVAISTCIVVALLAFVFFVPLPVSRVRERGFVQVQPTEITHVSVEVSGILKEIKVQEGQYVSKGKVLAEFTSLDLEKQHDQLASQMELKKTLVKTYNEQIGKEQDAVQKSRLNEQRAKAEAEQRQAEVGYKLVKEEMRKLTLRAPRSGVVMGLPSIDEVGKGWDNREQSMVFCSIGDKTKLRVLVPLSPADYDLLKENLKSAKNQRTTLDATIRVQGHDKRLWAGKISQLPKSDAKDVPIELTTKAGGPLAVKPTSAPGKIEPQGQVFLVGIDFIDSDETIAVHSHAQVKIHCEHRSCAWWVYRTVATTFDIGLMMKW